MQIRFTLFKTPLGWMLLAATEQGVCWISLGDKAEELEAQLAVEYPHATRQRDDAGLANWAKTLLAATSGMPGQIDLPLDTPGTPFQQQVWAVLRQIPYGQTRTYAQVAAAIGHPSAVRAAAHAIATNPLAVLTPCHRVVRSDGGLGGYRWGVERKKQLLQVEEAF